MLETWACGILLDIVPFEQLVKDGIERYERVAFEEEEEGDRED